MCRVTRGPNWPGRWHRWPSVPAWRRWCCACGFPDGRDAVLDVEGLDGGVTVRERPPGQEPIQPLTPYRQKVLRANRFGAPYPYEIVRMLTPPAEAVSRFPAGQFVEHDLDEHGDLVPVSRPYGRNSRQRRRRPAAQRHREGAGRDDPGGAIRATRPAGWATWPSRSAGGSSRALDLAERMRIPVEWFALSSGAMIAMDSGIENMDWIAAVLRRLIEFTQARRGGEHRCHRGERGRPAVLERRGDHADAHPRHPGDDTGQRDGADRQAGAGFLRRGVGRGQLRYRRLRPDHGTQRPGPVLGAHPRRRVRHPAAPLRVHLRRAR